MRILVGTLYTIENEIGECLAALHRQTYPAYDHFIVEGLPDRDAHDALYGRFMKLADDYDLFLKLDADMVIENEFLFEQIVGVFRSNNHIDMFTIPVYDYFSRQFILGLHTFRNTVTWQLRDDVFTDKHNVHRTRIFVDQGPLTPAAIHCPNPSPFQSFHLGIHRGVKIRVALQRPVQLRNYLLTHVSSIDYTWKNFLREEDTNLGFASLAAELSIQGQFTEKHIPYSNQYAESEFTNEYANWDLMSIRKTVGRMRVKNRMRYPLLMIAPAISNVFYPAVRKVIPARVRAWFVGRLDSMT
jgi:hypothetical protein